MPKNRGFSLLELLISLAVSLLLGLALLSLARQFQNWNSNLGLLLERDAQLRQAPLLLVRQLAAAGNNRFSQAWPGLETRGGELRIQADIDGAEGFPDERLKEPFESVALRRSANDLQLRSGRGSFQPLLKNVSDFQTLAWDPPLLRLRIAAETERRLREAETKAVEQIELSFYLWNFRDNWFEETEG